MKEAEYNEMNRVYKSKIIFLALPILFIGTLSCASLTGRTAGEIVEDPIITASVKATYSRPCGRGCYY